MRGKVNEHAQVMFRIKKEMDALQAKHNYEQRRHRVHKHSGSTVPPTANSCMNTGTKFVGKKSTGVIDDWIL